MFELINKIGSLADEDQHVFLGMIHDSESLMSQFHSFLKSADEKTFDYYLNDFLGNDKEILKNEVLNSIKLGHSELSEIFEIICQTFNKIDSRKK